MPHPATYTIVILNDGETWTEAAGCHICVVTAKDMEILDMGGHIEDIDPISVIGLRDSML